MSKMSDISIEIQDRLASDQEPQIIARVMEIPIQWVYAEVDSMEEIEDEYIETQV
jgi:hypothetical protein